MTQQYMRDKASGTTLRPGMVVYDYCGERVLLISGHLPDKDYPEGSVQLAASLKNRDTSTGMILFVREIGYIGAEWVTVEE